MYGSTRMFMCYCVTAAANISLHSVKRYLLMSKQSPDRHTRRQHVLCLVFTKLNERECVRVCVCVCVALFV